MEKYFIQIKELIVYYSPKVIGALVILIVGLIIISTLTKTFKKVLEKRGVDKSLHAFLGGLFNTLLKVMLIISAMSMVGIEMTSFIAILGAAGLAVGMALSGTLQNFAGGVMILIFKPFKAGDFIEAQGYSGVVSQIQIFSTILKTPDNKTIIIPNGGLSTGSLINYSTEEKRRVDWTFGIGYGDSVEKAKEVIVKLINEDNRVINDPEPPFVAVSELADSSVNFAVRAWVKAPDYWSVYFNMNEKVYNTFEKEGLNIPYPQMDVHVHNNK